MSDVKLVEEVEIWKDIPGYTGLYQASTLGRIRSLSKCVNRKKKGSFPKEGRVLIQTKTGGKYMAVCLSVDGKKLTKTIHQLVAKTFLANPENKPQVNHIDGDPTNNRLQNLEWCTYHENLAHSLNTGLFSIEKCKPIKGSSHANAKLNESNVREMRKLFLTHSDRKVAKIYGVSANAIFSIRTGKTWKHAE